MISNFTGMWSSFWKVDVHNKIIFGYLNPSAPLLNYFILKPEHVSRNVSILKLNTNRINLKN